MKLKAYSVFDSKAEAYGLPHFFVAKGLAIRAFTDLTNDPQSLISKHPEDFDFFEIGEFDDLTGKFTPNEVNIHLGKAIEYKSQG